MYINENHNRNLTALSANSSPSPVTENKQSTFKHNFKSANNSQETIDKISFSTPLQVRKHKLFRGIRCWFSFQLKDKHSENVRDPFQRAQSIMGNLQNNPGSAAVLSFGKSGHNVIILNNDKGKYCLTSTESTIIGSEEGKINKIRSELADTIAQWQDNLKDENIVYLKGLNTNKMLNKIKILGSEGQYNYNPLSRNCAKYVAEIILSGYEGDKSKLQHNREWQMPANTLELAKEIHNNLIS